MPRTARTDLEDAAMQHLTDDVSRRLERIREAADGADSARRTREQFERAGGDR